MVPPIVHEMQARTALNAAQGMPFKWSLNPYKGCAHACSYCYARAYHSYLDLPPSSFESQLFVKTNVAELLRGEVRRGTWRGEGIAIGTGTDPYQRLEGQYHLTRRCLEVLAEVDNPGSVTTKGTLVTRDADVLGDLASRTDFSVNISLISLDRDLLRTLEPGAPAPNSRLRAIERLTAAGVPVSVFLAPVLPGLTDDVHQLEELVRAAAEHGARDVWASALRLAPGVKEHFLDVVRGQFPQLGGDYERFFGYTTNAPTGYQIKIQARVDEARRSAGITHAVAHQPLPVARRGQLSLPI
jgi:DNA repair photolyase